MAYITILTRFLMQVVGKRHRSAFAAFKQHLIRAFVLERNHGSRTRQINSPQHD